MTSTIATTIMISKDLKEELNAMKLFENETYENIINDLIEDRKFLTQETLKEIAEAETEAKKGETISLEEIKRKMDLIK